MATNTKVLPQDNFSADPEDWTVCTRRAFAKLVKFGPAVLGGASLNMLYRQGLVVSAQGGRLVPDEAAVRIWLEWVEHRTVSFKSSRMCQSADPQKSKLTLV